MKKERKRLNNITFFIFLNLKLKYGDKTKMESKKQTQTKAQKQRIAKIKKYISLFNIKPIGYNIHSDETTLFFNDDYAHLNSMLWKITQDLNDCFILTYTWRQDNCKELCEDYEKHNYNDLKYIIDDELYLCIDVKLK